MTSKELLKAVAADLESHANNWVCQVFTNDEREALLELADYIREVI